MVPLGILGIMSLHIPHTRVCTHVCAHVYTQGGTIALSMEASGYGAVLATANSTADDSELACCSWIDGAPCSMLLVD